MSEPLKLPESPLPGTTPLPELPVVATRRGGLASRPLDAGLVLRQTTSEEFLPSVRPWVRSAGLVMLGSFAAGVALMAVWPYRVVVRGSGVVRPSGETSVINAPFAARVRRVLVQPNERVQTGQVLALLDPTDLEGKQQQLSQSRRALAQQSQALVNQGLAALQAAELEVEKSEAGLRFAEAEYRRFQQLGGTGSITVTQLEEKEESYNVARAQLAKARQAVAEQRSRNSSDQAQLKRELVTNSADKSQIARDLAQTSLTAPVPGVLFSLKLRNPGQMLAAGEELARISPSQAGLLVKVLVPSENITKVEVDQRADLRITGCPYPDYGTLKARVVSIAPEASLPGSADPEAGRNGTAQPAPIPGGYYEVTLQPPPPCAVLHV
ncbi:HlyD family secretion protein [Synechococcus sp. CBW1006]|uniref:HlyD family secretion protein n=1 Tax=Synechococcus sp. CBW1006 TaxID=1353138 RepID=UPI0018CD91FC|nr:HlyD family efflux transporter periplasmic adaptor subunit [Synechococcus sp. CBW1006]QPN65651.1 HlyD family efflux transporter periplasmic adaptor subunit [Synechococcus sp. CBW1006]